MPAQLFVPVLRFLVRACLAWISQQWVLFTRMHLVRITVLSFQTQQHCAFKESKAHKQGMALLPKQRAMSVSWLIQGRFEGIFNPMENMPGVQKA